MNIIGKTECGKPVVSGLGKLYFESGLPLSLVFDKCESMNMKPSWLHLYKELSDNGMKHSRIIHLLHEQLFETYGKEFRDKVIETLEKIMNKTGN